jgi:molybdate transport system substrate-binding protein
MRRLSLSAALVLAASVALSGCGGGDSKTTIRVLAASSLTGSFDELAKSFESEHSDVDVVLVYDSSATLAEQVTEGAPADVLATADLDTMQSVVDAGDASDPSSFAGNTAVLVTPPDNPGHITSFADLGRKDVSFVECVDTAPCGKVGAALLSGNGITAKPKSFEDNVKAVLAKVTSGEVDAGIVYVTDAQAAGDTVKVVQIPGAAQQVTSYGIVVVDESKHADLAKQFVDLVLSDQGQQVLHGAGFAPAP